MKTELNPELKHLIQKIIQISLLIVVPASALAYFIWSPLAMLALFSGGFLAVGGFILSVIITEYVLAQGGSVIFTIALHFFKVITTALIAWLFVRQQGVLGIFFAVGYSVLVVAIMFYTRKLD